MKGIQTCITCGDNEKEPKTHFLCPNDGIIHQLHINFLCNTCKADELIYLNDMYVCPECFTSPRAFECRLCGSQDVTYVGRDRKPQKLSGK